MHRRLRAVTVGKRRWVLPQDLGRPGSKWLLGPRGDGMVFVQFATPVKLIEYTDVNLYAQRVGRWMEQREAENCVILGSLPNLSNAAGKTEAPRTRMFAVEEGNDPVAAAILNPDGILVTTWAPLEIIPIMVDGLIRGGCKVASICGPAHFSESLAEHWAHRTGQQMRISHGERLYQLTHVIYRPPESGRLTVVTPVDRDLVTTWLADFYRAVGWDHLNLTAAQESLFAQGQFFLWRQPDPVAMAARVLPTRNGACINSVYTAPAQRGRGYAATVVSALALHLLSNGQRFCCIITDADNHRLHNLYQRIGARTLGEVVTCSFVPHTIADRPGPSQRAPAAELLH